MFVGLDQYIWTTAPGEGFAGDGYWSVAPGATWSLDTASHAQIVAAQLGQPRGWVMAAWKDKPDGFDDRGGIALASEDWREARPADKLRQQIGDVLGFVPTGDTLLDWQLSLMIGRADPANLDAPISLQPTVERKLLLAFQGVAYYERRFVWGEDATLTAKLRDQLRLQLNAIRVEALDGKLVNPVTKEPDSEYHLRVADALIEKLGGKEQSAKEALWVDLKPAEWDRTEEPKKHATTITESFNTSNGDTLGPDLSWTELTSDIDIVSNQARTTTALACFARADSDLSGTDHQVQAAMGVSTETSFAGPGLVARKDSTTTITMYFGRYIYASGTTPDVHQTFRFNSGTATQLGSNVSETFAGTRTNRLKCNGSQIEWDSPVDTNKLSTTDGSPLGSGLRCGIRGQRDTGGEYCHWDDFQAEDLAAAFDASFFPHSRQQQPTRQRPRAVAF